MAGYHNFAYYYDAFNGAADYDALHRVAKGYFDRWGLPGPLVADLGCGTGEMSLRLARDGYDLIAVDASADMLSLLNEKQQQAAAGQILLLQQDLTRLDLYGTIHGAVCFFDTLNHLGPVEKMRQAIARVGLFMEEGGLFLFDVNTPCKHLQVLGNETITLRVGDMTCLWANTLQQGMSRTQIRLQITDRAGRTLCKEAFYEYYCEPQLLRQACEESGFSVLEILDGEQFCAPHADSQRLLFVAKKVIQCQSL